MGILDNIIERAGFVRKGSTPVPGVTGDTSGDPFAIWRQAKGIDPQRAMEVYTTWTYACIRAIAEELGAMRFRLYKVGKDRDEEVYEHELLDLLGGVNLTQTGLELLFTTGAHLEAVGNCYWYLDGVTNEKSKPSAIYLMNPARVEVAADREQFPPRVSGYRLRTKSGKKLPYAPHQVLHLKYPNPNDPLVGVGTVQSIAQWIDADNYAMEFNRRFFLEGARIGGFLETESVLTTEQSEYVKKSFEDKHRGVANAYRTLMLPKGLKYKEAGQTQKDLDFANLMNMMRDHILAGFRVPRTVLGITDDVNRANAEATNYVFALRTIKPKMELIVSYLNEFLVPRYGDNLYLSFDSPVPEDREIAREDKKSALAGQPWQTINEVREAEGLPPILNGDTVMGDFNKIPVGQPQKEVAAPTKRSTNRPRTRHARNAKLRQGLAEGIAKAAAAALESSQKRLAEIKRKDISTLSDEDYEVVWRVFTERVETHRELLEERLRQFNARQQAEVLKNLEQLVEEKSLKQKTLFGDTDWPSILTDLALPITMNLFDEEAKEAASLIGIVVDPLTPETRTAITVSMERMSQSYNDYTTNLLEEKLEQGLSEGASLDEMTNLVKDVYEFSDTVRAERLARTETFRVGNLATKEAWKQSGVVKTIKWYTAADERVCQFCGPLHGKVIDINENFFNLGDEMVGSEGGTLSIDYADVEAPPVHPNCRCYTRPEEISIE